MKSLFLTLVLLIATTGSLFADYFGRFDGDPVGTFINGADRPLFRLYKSLTYTDPNGLAWTAPSGEIVDGASIPQFAWSIIGGPFSGNYLRAAIVHDYYCCSKSREYGDTHRAFWRGLRLDGIGSAKAYVMWAAVRAFGPDHWDVDPDLEPPVPCKGGDSVLVGKAPQTNGIAAGKVVALARTLETTNGAVLDVVDGEPVLAGTERAEDHLDSLRAAAAQGFDAPRDALGLFSAVTDADLELLAGKDTDGPGFLMWDLNSIPALEPFVTEEMRARYQFYRREDLQLSSPVGDIYDEAFWGPTLKALGG